MINRSQDLQLTGLTLTVARAAWAGLTLLVMALYLWVFIIPGITLEDIPYGVLMPVGYFAIAVVIFLRRSDLVMGLLTSLMLIFLGPYLLTGANLAIGEQAGWRAVNALLVAIGAGTLALFIFMFPNGRFVPRWTPWFALAATGAVFVGNFGGNWLEGTSVLLILLTGIGCQVYRYARVSTQSERQQTKWVLVGLSGMVIWLLLWFLILEPELLIPPENSIVYTLYLSVGSVVTLLLPLSIALSILRYRLWEVDLLIRRTLVYGALTVTLALLYLGAVVVLQQLLRAVTGQGFGLSGVEGSPIVIVVSTLVIAALFSPLRRRIQSDIDRRFYRSKYDAQQVLAAFVATARDETDLDALAAELLRAVEDTMQPASVSLWLGMDGTRNRT